jgi:hypothetical protein
MVVTRGASHFGIGNDNTLDEVNDGALRTEKGLVMAGTNRCRDELQRWRDELRKKIKFLPQRMDRCLTVSSTRVVFERIQTACTKVSIADVFESCSGYCFMYNLGQTMWAGG